MSNFLKSPIYHSKAQNDLCYEIPFVIIKGDYIPLLGSQAAQQMQLLTVQYDNIDEPLSNNCFSCSGAFPSQATAKEPSSSPKANLSKATHHTAGLTRDHIMKNYADVFEGLGHMPGKLHLDIDETVKPVVMPPRRVPLALKSNLKDELDRLEALGVITKVKSLLTGFPILLSQRNPMANCGCVLTPST